MNIQEADILRSIRKEPFINQRVLANTAGCSLGAVNKSLRALSAEGLLDSSMQLTQKAQERFRACRPMNAIILAAGFGMRMVPINLTAPKALLEVGGERLIERLIRQLHEAGIRDITVVVGFMKEAFEYLIDEYGVELAVNADYASRNNLHSLALAADRIHNTYIVPCDIYCAVNPFSEDELYSWYMVAEAEKDDSGGSTWTSRMGTANDASYIRVNRKRELVKIHSSESAGSRMIGISYLLEPEAGTVRSRLIAWDGGPAAGGSKLAAWDGGPAVHEGRALQAEIAGDREADARDHSGDFWEETLYRGSRMIVSARTVPGADFVEINTYEQLRDLDAGSGHLKSEAIRTIAEVLSCREEEIVGIRVLKKGMTNRSFLFSVRGTKYIMRIPGEGTDKLIDRRQEAEVYRAIRGCGLCDDPVFLNPENGYKITKFLEGVRVCDPQDLREGGDVDRCMRKLRAFHSLHLKVGHTFDIFGQIRFYESLWEGAPSIYRDYERTRERVFSLKPFIDSQPGEWCLTHIDAVPDNFLFYEAGLDAGGEPGEQVGAGVSDHYRSNDGEEPGRAKALQLIAVNGSESDKAEALQLTDWEYAGMQDPHVDLAMFCIYAMYDRQKADRLIDLYFDGGCSRAVRTKIYCYIAACGLLWSNWCEYKRKLGVEFGEYSLRQYRYAKEYCRYARELMQGTMCDGAGD